MLTFVLSGVYLGQVAISLDELSSRAENAESCHCLEFFRTTAGGAGEPLRSWFSGSLGEADPSFADRPGTTSARTRQLTSKASRGSLCPRPTTFGRHRAGRHNPGGMTELTGMVARAGESGVKASTVPPPPAAWLRPSPCRPRRPPATARSRPSRPPVAREGRSRCGQAALRRPSWRPTPRRLPRLPRWASSAFPPSRSPATARRRGPGGAAAADLAVGHAVGHADEHRRRCGHLLGPAPVTASGSIVDIARSLQRHLLDVYGGTTPAGFDCSGFTRYVCPRRHQHPAHRHGADERSDHRQPAAR